MQDSRMNPLYLTLAPLAFLSTAMPAGAPGAGSEAGSVPTEAALTPAISEANSEELGGDPAMLDMLEAMLNPPGWDQIRLEQRIIIRIAPRAGASAPPGASAIFAMPDMSKPPKFDERKMAQCLPVSGIAGVEATTSNRLMLFLRDGRLVNASLGKGCKAQDFYLGFYVARSADGMICAGRDTLQSRNGANCQLGKLRQMVLKTK